MNTSDLLTRQVAIVTGAGRGIGRATALALAQAGAAVVLAARSEDEITGVADEIKHEGGQTLAVPTDVSDAGQVDYLLVLALRAFGRVDILVNNASLFHPAGKVWESSPTAWQEAIAVNVIGPYLCARAVLPHMLERGSGRIINLSSGMAARNVASTSAYSASKAAVERFSGILALEVEGRGIVVVILRPGVVDTSMQAELRQTPRHLLPAVDRWQALHDQGNLRPPAEPAEAILWLSSPFANDCNGQCFNLDDSDFRKRFAADLGRTLLPGRERN